MAPFCNFLEYSCTYVLQISTQLIKIPMEFLRILCQMTFGFFNLKNFNDKKEVSVKTFYFKKLKLF